MTRSAKVLIKNLKKILEDMGWTYARLAKETGMAQPQISLHLNEKSQPTLEALDRYAQALGVTPYDLLLDDQVPESEDHEAIRTAYLTQIKDLRVQMIAMENELKVLRPLASHKVPIDIIRLFETANEFQVTLVRQMLGGDITPFQKKIKARLKEINKEIEKIDQQIAEAEKQKKK